MATIEVQRALSVHHWNEGLFSFTTTRNKGFRFENGQFVMLGLQIEGRPLLRAYSIASPNYAEHLEFLSIVVPDGALTSRLKDLAPGDPVFVGSKATGTLLVSDVSHGRNLYLLCSGTGLAPFMSIVRDPQTYEPFDKVVLVHGVRWRNELAYADLLQHDLVRDEFIGSMVREKLLYYPTVTREPFRHQGRIPALLMSGQLTRDLGLPALDPAVDRAMICGSTAMLSETTALLDHAGFKASPGIGQTGEYVYERSFVSK